MQLNAKLYLSWMLILFALAVALILLGVQHYFMDRMISVLLLSAGTILLLSFFRGSRQLKFADRYVLVFFALLVLIYSFIVRWTMLNIIAWDMKHYFIPWYNTIVQQGHWLALTNKISGYSQFYLYLLTLASYLPINKVIAIKLIPIIFDYLIGFWVYKIVRLKYSSNLMVPLLAVLVTLFLPSLVISSSGWGQFDSIYIACLLGSMYYLMRLCQLNKKDTRGQVKYKIIAVLLFGLAITIKLQAAFFALPFILLYVSRQLSWRFFTLVPLVYYIITLPSIIFLGLPHLKAFDFNSFNRNFRPVFNLNAPTIYRLIPTAPYKPFSELGILIALLLIITIAFMVAYRKKIISPEGIIRSSLISLLVLPYLMPGIWARYFLPAELMAIIFAFYFPKYIFLPAITSTIFLIINSADLRPPFKDLHPVFTWPTLAVALGVLVVIVLRDYYINEIANKTSVD